MCLFSIVSPLTYIYRKYREDGPLVKIVDIPQLEAGRSVKNLAELCKAMVGPLLAKANIFHRFTFTSLTQLLGPSARRNDAMVTMVRGFVEICIRLKIFIPGSKRGSFLVIRSRLGLLEQEMTPNIPPLDPELLVKMKAYLTVLDCILHTVSGEGEGKLFSEASMRTSLPIKRRKYLLIVNMDNFIRAGLIEPVGSCFRLRNPLPSDVDELFLRL